MISLSSTPEQSWRPAIFILGIPLLVVCFLAFIDEGNYDLRWMQDPGNWIACGLYWLAMILGEFLVALLVPRSWPLKRKLWLIIGLGMCSGVLLMVGFWAFVTGFYR